MCFGVCFYLSTSNDQVFFFIYATTRFSLQKKNINKSKLSQLTRIFSFSKEKKVRENFFFGKKKNITNTNATGFKGKLCQYVDNK